MDAELKQLYDRGKELYEEGKYSEAEPLLKEVIRRNPKYADVLNKLGVIANLNGELRQAARYLEQALAINPNYTEASLNLAITYNAMGEFNEAAEVFSKAAQIAHPTPTALDPYVAGKIANEHYKLGNMYLDVNMYDEAIDEYQKAIKLQSHKGFADVHTKLGVALRNKGLFDEAVSQLMKAKEINALYGQAWVQLGITYYMTGKYDLALAEWEEALRRMPGLKEAKTYIEFIKKGK
jgi:tetratricopeptide (TPR) repeat protein